MYRSTYSYVKVKDKITGKIGVVRSISYGIFNGIFGKRTEVKYEDSEVFYYGNDFEELVEVINYDYEYLQDHIMNFLKLDENRNILDMIARRYDSGYFSIGKLVYFTSNTWINNNNGHNFSESFCYGPGYPYIIVDISEKLIGDSNDCDVVFYIAILPYSKQIKDIPIEVLKNYSSVQYIPAYPSKFEIGDAYSILARYDKEF